jgi:hypothetical protein
MSLGRAAPSRRLMLAALSAALVMPGLAAPAGAQSCCGAVTPDAARLVQRLDASGVDHLWLPYKHVNWETGATVDDPLAKPAATHCSAFVASFAKQLGVYILRPPEHSDILRANAQMRWLSSDGPAAGWRPLPDAASAQASANQGNLVVAVFENVDRHKAGHIAFIRPGTPDAARLAAVGPDVTQAGAVNAIAMPARQAFSHHSGAWPDQIRYFEHAVAWAR